MKYITSTWEIIKHIVAYITWKNIKRLVTVVLFTYIVASFVFTTLSITDKLGYTSISKVEAQETTCPKTIYDFVNMKVNENMNNSAIEKQIRAETETMIWRAIQTQAEISQSVLN